jgi:hypothetical protein
MCSWTCTAACAVIGLVWSAAAYAAPRQLLQPVLPLDVSVLQQPVLSLDLSGLLQPMLLLDIYCSLCCLWMCLSYSSRAVIGLVWSTAAYAAPRHLLQSVLPLDVSVLQQPVLSLDLSGLLQPSCSKTCTAA